MVSNSRIAQLLGMIAAGSENEHRARAYRTVSHDALVWPGEAADLVAGGGELKQLPHVGDKISALIESWIEDPPEVEEVLEELADFLSVAEARTILRDQQEWRDAVRGDLQMHTTFSDGSETLSDMVDGCSALAYEYCAITDHSKGLKVARGIDEARLIEQDVAIQALNEQLSQEGSTLEVLRSIEMNLDKNGDGDMEAEALLALDLVLGSFHSSLRTTEDQTERYVAALENPYVDVLAHPRGRRHGQRAGLYADWEEVFSVAEETGTALEINCSILRQDLQPELLEKASSYDFFLTLGTDSHSLGELSFMEVGLASAVQGGIARDRIVNTWPLEGVREWVSRRRAAALGG